MIGQHTQSWLAETAGFTADLFAGLRSVNLFDTPEGDARLHTSTKGHLVDDDGRAIGVTLHNLPLARFHNNGTGEAQRSLAGLMSRFGGIL